MEKEKLKLKVVHIITKLELGGAQLNTLYTYENLDESQFETYLVSGPGGILTGKVSKKDRFIIAPHLVRAISPFKDLKTLFFLYRFLKKVRPHIVHTHSSKAGILGRIAAAVARVPVIIHSVHGFSFSPFQSFLKRTFYTTAEKIIAHKTTHFIFVANDDIITAQQQKLVHNNYSLIRSGFPLKKFQSRVKGTSELREGFNLMEDDFVCGIIAPFKAQKGLFHLIDIAVEVLAVSNKNIFFIILGDGDLRPAIESKLKEKGIFDRFRLPGFVFDIDVVMDVFDIGVSTALWEGLPQSLVQFRLKKLAVVASNIPGNREVIVHEKNGYLVDVSDRRLFARRILELVNDEETRQRLANNADDFSEWDADVMVRRQGELYRSLVQNK